MQFSHTHSIRRSHFGWFGSISAFDDRSLAAFPLPFSRTIAFLLLSHTLHIRWSHFGRFCSLSAFDGRVLAAFPPHSHTPHLPPGVLAYDRIFAAFAHSQHSTVAFWQVLHNLCIRRSRFGSFSSPHSPTPHLPPVLAYDRVFAAFAHSQHLTVSFW